MIVVIMICYYYHIVIVVGNIMLLLSLLIIDIVNILLLISFWKADHPNNNWREEQRYKDSVWLFSKDIIAVAMMLEGFTQTCMLRMLLEDPKKKKSVP